jgi:Serine hydrolase (FSH1)
MLGLLLSTLPAVPGCFSYRSATDGLVADVPLASDAWPEFDTQPVAALVDTPSVIEHSIVDPERLPPIWKKEGERGVELMKRFHTDDLLISQLDDHGLLRVWNDRRDGSLNPVPSPTDDKPSSFDRNASYLTGPESLRQREFDLIELEFGEKKDIRGLRARLYGLESSGVVEEWQLYEGMKMALPEDVDTDSAGLIVHITSLIENKYEQALTNRLRSYGYAAGYVDSDIFLDGPNVRERKFQSSKRTKRISELVSVKESSEGLEDTFAMLPFSQIKEKLDNEFPPIDSGFEIDPDTDLESLASLIAREVDEKIAVHAYAVESLVRACDQLHPQLVDKPIIVIGYSAGSLSAPAVIARLAQLYPDRPLRLVLIGSGGDLLSVAEGSMWGSSILRLHRKDDPEPSAKQLEELKAAYLQRTKLDPLVIVPSIRSVPTLHVYATNDKAVPTASAMQLNEAHAQMDELKHAGNHGTLFFFLQGQAGKIRSWLREQFESS